MMKIIPMFLILVVVALFSILPIPVFAAEEIKSFDVDIIVHKDGSFDVIENIAYDFGEDERHGIFRKIPLISKVGELYRLLDVSFKQVLNNGVPEKYSREIDNEEASIKIGKADVEISGQHNYQIFYTVKNGVGSNFDDHDEIYWNITGNSWAVPIRKATASLRTDFGLSPQKVICYTGSHGSSDQNCRWDSSFSVSTDSGLNAFEGLTSVWGFPKGTFPASTLQSSRPISYRVTSDVTDDPEVVKYIVFLLLGFWGVLNLLVGPGLILWYVKNKSKSRFGYPTVNFDIPKDALGQRVSPAEAGSVDIHRVDQNDIVATIFDLAIRKYIKIEQIKKEKVLGVFGGGEDFRITKLKHIDEELTAFEQKLLGKLFEVGTSVELSSLKEDFYLTFSAIEKKIFDQLVHRGYYKKNPKIQMSLLLSLGTISLLLGGVILGPILIYLSRKLNGRTTLGDELDWKIDGLKIFLKNMQRHHNWQAKNLYTVEEYIPYAIAFGYIKEFMEQLKVIYPNYRPSWYSGNLAFYSATNNMFNSMSTTFTAHAPSSSSGFSGGGFSGGGGGGGGGGSW